MNFPEGMHEHLMNEPGWRLVRTVEHGTSFFRNFTATVALGDLGVTPSRMRADQTVLLNRVVFIVSCNWHGPITPPFPISSKVAK